ncbi:MAG: amino acid adenylation domain-containing protein [Synechococcales bacterium]|nr:amino acid adenylation domain-containing protein [Synechococcales bacterium]
MSQSIAHLTPEQKRQLLSQLLQKKAQQEASQRFPLSFAQQRLWFIEQIQPGTAVYVIPAVLRLEGPLQVEALHHSLGAIAQRHAILRTRFIADGGQPQQQVEASLDLPLPVLDLSQPSEAEVQAQIQRVIAAPFDLSQAPLLRCHLIQLEPHTHLLVVAIHHIVADYWSLRLLMAEMAALYTAEVRQQSPLLPELPIQYADYATWQRQQLSPTGEVDQPSRLEQQLNYWKQQLSNPPPLLDLPTDYLRPAIQTFRGARQSFTLSPALSNALKSLAQQHQATLFMLLLAAFQALLHRYTEQTDIWVGSTVTNRDRRETQNLIGLFVNNLVFRAQVNGDLPFHQFLQQVRETALDAYANQDVPFEAIVDALQVNRHLSHNALFQVMFILHNTPTQTFTLPDLHITALEPTATTARFDLGLDMHETPDGLTGVFEYNTDLFKPSTIQRLVGHFRTMLGAIAENPESPIGLLPLLTPAEQQQLHTWNQTEQPIPERCVHELIADRAKATPDVIAVIFEDTALSYQELDHRANQLAHYLLEQGVQPGDRVALCLERSAELVITLLAILKTGATYVPLDPTYPVERLRFILEDAQVALLITANVSGVGSRPTAVRPCPYPSTHLPVHPSTLPPSTLAYLIYTSGSTGTPKGVPVRHQSLTNLLTSMAQAPSMTAQDTLLAITTPAFDIAALELFLPLIVGGTLIVASQDTVRDPHKLAAQLEQHDVTLMQATPATWRLLLESGWPGKANLKLLCGGEALDLALAQQLLNCGAELWNLYGPTETTIWSSALRIEASLLQDGTIPIGPPIANTQFYVLDSRQNPVPLGIPGELHIGGIGLSPGYWNRDDLTVERFIKAEGGEKAEGRRQKAEIGEPFILHPSSFCLYKTGDRVLTREDGTLEYLGRLDYQVKLRGFRIELGEIEAVLSQHPNVAQAVVMLQGDCPQEAQLVAYVVPNPKSKIQNPKFREHLAQHLPAYMVPTQFVRLDTLPLTPNGKVDRKALPKPESTETVQVSMTSHTLTEELLANIWSAVLNQYRIGRDDNFFELGGHSLLATRVVAQVRQLFGVELPVRSLFEQPTLSQLAIAIDTLKAGDHPTSLEPIPLIERSGALPLSHAQHRQWILAQLEPDSPFYIIPTATRVKGSLSVDLLYQSLEQIIERHEVLRTAFRDVDGKAQIKIHAEVAIAIPLVDLSGLDEINQQEQVHQHLRAEAQTPFDLGQAPLLRMKVLRLAAQDQVVVLSLHHIIADGWSMGILVQELAQVYDAMHSGRPAKLPPLPIQYVDYTAWQQQQSHQNHLDYWKNQLQGAPPFLELPTDCPRPAVQSFAGATHEFQLTTEQTQALEKLSQQQGVTLFMTLLAAFQVLLHRYSGFTDLTIGTPIANRPRVELEGLIGMFVNTLVLRTDLSGNPRFEELLGRVREVALDAYAHQAVPFEQVVDALEVTRSWSYAPLFQVMFALQNAPMQAIALQELEWQPLSMASGTSKFDLTLSMRPTDTGLKGVLEYRVDLFEADTIQRMAGHLCTLLEAICAEPKSPIAKLPLLTEVEQNQLWQWNLTQAEYPRNLCIHGLFEQQVKKTPESIALLFNDQSFTYQELNTRSNQLAHYLQSLGIGPETFVGVYMERTPDMVVALLAILKAGGAYVPLDPNYPRDRLTFVIKDAQLSLLLTNSELSLVISETLPVLNPQNVRDAVLCKYPKTDPDSEVTGTHLAYVIYTSGSTGRPKGVAIEHHSTVALSTWAKDVFSPEQLRGVLAGTSICFDLSIFELFVPLSWGGTVILAENVLQLPELKAVNQVKLLNTVPSAAIALLRTGGIPTSVTTINLAGEPLPPALVQQLYQLPHIQHVFNLYGPSEDTTYSTYARMDEQETDAPIGRPIANTQVYVLDDHLQPVPIGIPGELYLGGDGLARGYLNRPELTAERFVPKPFVDFRLPILDIGLATPAQSNPKSKMQNPKWNCLYKTGDRVCYRPDGTLKYLGRLDNQVKIRGFRIELGEIEAVLLSHPNVEQAAVNPWTDEDGNQRLVAYVVKAEDRRQKAEGRSNPKSKIQNPKFRKRLAEKIPDYMLPAIFVELDELPCLPNGKLDRKALPVPEKVVGTQGDAPLTETEAALAAIWAELLPVAQVGLHDNFFELGGDSILALQAIAKAHQMGLQLTPRDLFQHQTIARLATVVSSRKEVQAEQGLVTGVGLLTPIQHWFFEQGLQHPRHWNQAVLLTVRKPMNPTLLEQTLGLLLTHHDALRAGFVQSEAGWQQQWQAPGAVPLTVVTGAAAELPRAIAETAHDLQSNFNLATGPLLKVAYFEFGDERRLLLVCHHLVIDGLSWRIVLGDLRLVYGQLEQGQTTQMPPKTTSFKQWAERLSAYACTASLEAERVYWQSIADTPVEQLPRDFDSEDNRMAIANRVTVSLSEADTRRLLQEVPGAYPVQINDLLLTALVLALEPWTGARQLRLELEGHGREDLPGEWATDIDLSRTVGWFTSLFPVSLDLTAAPTLGAALKQVKETLRVVPNRGLGYSVGRYLHPDSLPSVAAEVRFNYLGQLDQVLAADDWFLPASESTGAARSPEDPRPTLLEIDGLISRRQLRLNWTYSTAIHQCDTITHLAEAFLDALQQLINYCLTAAEDAGYTPSDFPHMSLSQGELDDLLSDL